MLGPQLTIENTVLWLTMAKCPCSNKMIVIRAGIHKLLVRNANRADPEQTAAAV